MDLPKHIEADGFDCLVASVVMVLMYWRIRHPALEWNIGSDFDGPEWRDVLSDGLSKIKNSGFPFNSVKRYLRGLDFPLTARMEYPIDANQLIRLMGVGIPPIVLYDRYYMLRGVKRQPYHAVVLIDSTEETLLAVDPALSPKFLNTIPIVDFTDAWSQIKNTTIIISQKGFKLRRQTRPSITLDRWNP